jgi:hypothetical protein
MNQITPSKEQEMNVKALTEQYRTLMLDPLKSQWLALEDGREGVGAIAAGYELEAVRQVGEDDKPTKRWAWMVKATSEISETPELVDAGVAASQNGGKRAASRAARKAQQRRIDQARKAQPKPKPRAKAAAKAK